MPCDAANTDIIPRALSIVDTHSRFMTGMFPTLTKMIVLVLTLCSCGQCSRISSAQSSLSTPIHSYPLPPKASQSTFIPNRQIPDLEHLI